MNVVEFYQILIKSRLSWTSHCQQMSVGFASCLVWPTMWPVSFQTCATIHSLWNKNNAWNQGHSQEQAFTHMRSLLSFDTCVAKYHPLQYLLIQVLMVLGLSWGCLGAPTFRNLMRCGLCFLNSHSHTGALPSNGKGVCGCHVYCVQVRLVPSCSKL